MRPNNFLKSVAVSMLLGIATIGCTDTIAFGDAALEKASGSEATKDTVFSNAEYTRQFLVGIYAEQYYGLPYVNNSTLPHSDNPYAGKWDALTDCWHMGWSGSAIYSQYYGGALTSAVTRSDGLDGPLFSFDKEHVWEAIRAVHLFLENIGDTPDMDDTEKGRLKAEARCLMASRMFDCFQHYGGIPVMTHSVEASEITDEFPRGTVEECVDFMVAQLDSAIAEPNFPWVTSDPTTMSGRWTRAGARALKAKILQFAASPFLNPEDGQPYYSGISDEVKPYVMYTDASQYKERWKKFYDAVNDFFNDWNSSGYYALQQAEGTNPADYRLAYRKGYYLTSSKEILHYVRVSGYDSFNAGRNCWHSWYTASVPRNLYWPTEEYVEMFPWSNGAPFEWDDAWDRTYNEDGSLKYGTGSSAGNPIFTQRSLNGMFVYGTVSSLQQLLRNVVLTRDPRLYEECIVNGLQKHLDWTTAAMSGDIWELWAGGTDALDGIVNQTGMFGTGYGYNKYYMGDGTTSSGDNQRYHTPWVVLSLNEMYLMRAEARLMCAGDVEGACEDVDVVRARVGLGTLKQRVFDGKAYTNSVYTDIAETNLGVEFSALLVEILRERACELGLQNIRWFDMIRYKRTDWMTKQLHGLEMHRLAQNSSGEWVESDTQWTNGDKLTNSSSTQPVYFTYKKVDITGTNVRYLWGKDPSSNEVRKWLLSPFPIDEINKGYGLVQNPGWE